MRFEPAITAFYGMFGSVGHDCFVTMNLYAGDRLVGVTRSEASTHVSSSFGHGFNVDHPIDRLEFEYGDASGVVVGGFMRVAEGKTSLGTVHIPDYGGVQGDEVLYDFACVFHLTPGASADRANTKPAP